MIWVDTATVKWFELVGSLGLQTPQGRINPMRSAQAAAECQALGVTRLSMLSSVNGG